MRFVYVVIIIVLFNSCRKALDVPAPTDRIVSDAVYSTDRTATAVLTGLYYNMSNGGPFSGDEGITFNCGLSADEFLLVSENEQWKGIWQNALTSMDAVPFWGKLYSYIYVCNTAIEGLTKTESLTPSIKQQLLGEALFVRAICYWYLVNIFGDVPLIMSTDAQVSKTAARESSEKVLDQVVTDLEQAKSLLGKVYLSPDMTTPTTSRVRPTVWADMALLSKVYLYQKKWNAAKELADTLIAHPELFNLVALNGVFLASSKEAIWQIEPVNNKYTKDGYLFNWDQPVYFSESLLAAFENGDQRKVVWMNRALVNGQAYYYPYKYKMYKDAKEITECLTILRLGEVYLTRAEALAKLGFLDIAKSDVNAVRKRAGLTPVISVLKSELLDQIHHERQVELFAEMGDRWLELKRNGEVDDVMAKATAQKGGVWASYQQLYPIPANERQLDPALTQNEGY